LPFHLGLLAAMMLACLVGPAFAQDAVRTTGDYEIPGPVNAEDFLPKSAFVGKKLFVKKTAQNNGLQNIYRIRAGVEEYEITGSEAVPLPEPLTTADPLLEPNEQPIINIKLLLLLTVY